MCRAVRFSTKFWPSIRPGGGPVLWPKKYLNRGEKSLALRNSTVVYDGCQAPVPRRNFHGGGKVYARGASGASCGGRAAETLWRHGAGGVVFDRGVCLPRPGRNA